MKKVRVLLLLVIALIAVMAVVGCAKEAQPEEESAPADTVANVTALKFVGLQDEDFEISVEDIKAMETTGGSFNTISSTGEETVYEVKGASLSAIVAEYGKSLGDFDVIRASAADGYAIDIPKEILAAKDVVLMWECDGKPLEANEQPLRIAIEGERTMYWVSQLSELSFGGGAVAAEPTEQDVAETAELNKVYILETAASTLDSYEIAYFEATDSGIKVTELLDAFAPNAADSFDFLATDGYEKSEQKDVLTQGFIKMTGENAPLFIALDLPKGMHIKFILNMVCGESAFVSADSALESYEQMTVQDLEGINLIDIVDGVGLKADSYLITAVDGYSVEMAGRDLKKGILTKLDDGTYGTKFPADMPKNTSVKSILSIEAVGGTEKASEPAQEVEADNVLPEWVVTFDGLSDGSFDFDSARAESKIGLTTIEVDFKGEMQEWQGYKLLDILKWLRVESFEYITFVAGDGYESTMSSDAIDDAVILGVIQDGNVLSEQDNVVQLVCGNDSPKSWVKGLAKVIVK